MARPPEGLRLACVIDGVGELTQPLRPDEDGLRVAARLARQMTPERRATATWTVRQPRDRS